MDYLTMTFLSMILIGFNTFAVKLVLQNFPPAVFLILEFMMGIAVLFFYLRYSSIPLIWNKYAFYACLVGAWWAGVMLLYYMAIAKGPLSVVIPIFNLSLIIPAILGFIFLKEAITFSKIFGLLFACLSVFLLTR